MRLPAHTLLSVTLVLTIGAVDPAQLSAQTDTRPALEAAPREPSGGGPAASVGELIDRTLDDFRRIPSLTNLGILTAGGIGATLGHTRDHDVSNAMSGS